MITLTAEIEIKGENPSPFIAGQSKLGNALFGETINVVQKIDKRNILSCENEIGDRADVEGFSVGLVSNGGNISFSDKSLRFLGYANYKILKGNEKATIFLENTISKTREKVGEYFATDWDYDNDNNVVNVSLGDSLEELQENEYKGFYFGYDNISAKSISWIYDKLVDASPKKYRIQKSNQLDTETKKLMDNTRIGVPFLDEGNLWAQFNKISNLCILRMYKTKNGETTVKYNGGN